MKRVVSLLTALLVMTSMATAQTAFGLEAGATIKKMSFSKDVYNANNCSGFFVGPKVKGTLPLLGLGADAALLYMQNKAVIDDVEKKNMSYSRVPVNIRWEIGPKAFGVFVTTGPQWDWYIGNSKLNTAEGLKATFEKNVISWNVGFGLMMLSHLQLGASYSIPLSKSGTVNDIYKGVVDNIEIKNKEWQIRLNYFF